MDAEHPAGTRRGLEAGGHCESPHPDQAEVLRDRYRPELFFQAYQVAIIEQFLHLLGLFGVSGPEAVAWTPIPDGQFPRQTCRIEQLFVFSLRDIFSLSEQRLNPDTQFADFDLARDSQAIFVVHRFLQSARLESKISLRSANELSARQFELLPSRTAGKIAHLFDQAKRHTQIAEVRFQPAPDQAPLGGDGQRQK